MSNSTRCVVTGLGIIDAIGVDLEENWANAKAGKLGIKEVESFDSSSCYAHVGAEVKKEFGAYAGAGSEKMDRVSLLLIKAAKEALADAKLDPSAEEKDRVGVIIGSCVGGALSIQKYCEDNNAEDKEIDTNDILKMSIGSIANNVAFVTGAGGVVTNVGNACAAGTISIEYACDLIRQGVGDAFICGGSDTLSALVFGGFTALHALDEDPCSPLNKSKGITLGEGAGAIIVESYEHAMKRGAKIYCDILGGGISSDAHHITAPRPDSEGQMNAMKRALKNSLLEPSDIDFINGHATGTPLNDSTEIQAMQTIFGENENTSVDSTKAMVGHCLGAAGAVEAVYTIKALEEGIVPPTIGYSEEDLEAVVEKKKKLDFVCNEAKERKIDYAMSNNFAFGGNNASVVFAKNELNKEIKEAENNRVFITGVGVVSPLGNSVEAYVEAVKNNAKAKATEESENTLVSNVTTDDYKEHELKLAFYRKLDRLSQLQAVSGKACLKNASVTISDENATDIGMIVGTADGPGTEIINFYYGLLKNGLHGGSAFAFPNTVYNAAGGYLSICTGIKGVNVTVTNGAQAGLQSLCYAANTVKTGEEKMMLATGIDENTAVIRKLYKELELLADKDEIKPYEGEGRRFTLSEGAVSLMLETENSAKERGAKVLAEVLSYGQAHDNVEIGSLKGSEAALVRAIEKALASGGIKADEIDAVVGFGNGNKTVDAIEKSAYKKIFDNKKPVINVKTLVGEARAAAATLSAAHAALALSGDIDKCEAFDLSGEGVAKKVVETKELKNILVTSYAHGGSYTAVIIKRV